MTYRQITSEERYRLSALRAQGQSNPVIAKALHRHRSTIWREVRRNRTRSDGRYRAAKAIEYTHARRARCRRHLRFSARQLARVWKCLHRLWSPEQISNHLRKTRQLRISHETIYRYIWRDLKCGGTLHRSLRHALKQRRKRYRSYDSRGRLAGKRMIHQRPRGVESRRTVGHWEIDTVLGKGSKHCIVSLVERKSGFLHIGKLRSRTVAQTSARTIALIRRHPDLFKTITADNGTEFHGYANIEKVTGVPFYFANPHHSWERGTNENTNGLIRQYLPKSASMARLTQKQCNAIAKAINTRPRKRHGYKTPQQILFPQ